jgi:hypothetical protein
MVKATLRHHQFLIADCGSDCSRAGSYDIKMPVSSNLDQRGPRPDKSNVRCHLEVKLG